MSDRPITPLRRETIYHIIRAVRELTNRREFVLIGTGAVIAQLRHIPFAMLGTRELDIYVDDLGEIGEEGEMGALIDANLGDGSQFDLTFGYYADGVEPGTAVLPSDWRSRAVKIELPDMPDVTCLCPSPNDIAVSKMCAWREKDIDWLKAGLTNGVLIADGLLKALTETQLPDGLQSNDLVNRLATLGINNVADG